MPIFVWPIRVLRSGPSGVGRGTVGVVVSGWGRVDVGFVNLTLTIGPVVRQRWKGGETGLGS